METKMILYPHFTTFLMVNLLLLKSLLWFDSLKNLPLFIGSYSSAASTSFWLQTPKLSSSSRWKFSLDQLAFIEPAGWFNENFQLSV